MDIVFVVLHYTAVNATLECVASIRSCIDTDSYRIVIVDNCSPDNSWEVLNDEYKADNDVILLHTEENLGFARGNNVGFRFAKENLSPRFIVLLNNDILLFQTDMYRKIADKYDKNGFAVMGPMIVTGDGKIISSPQRRNLMTREQAENGIKRYKRYLKLNKIGCDNIYKKLISKIRPYKPPFTVRERIDEIENVALHGSFLFFSEKYIEKFDGLDGRTFLYMEEDILFLHCKKNNLKTLYSPDLAVYHMEDASTNNVHKRSGKKNAFIYRNCIDSLKAYCEVLNSYDSL